MFEYVMIYVNDLKSNRDFYKAVIATLDMPIIIENDQHIAFKEGEDYPFWLSKAPPGKETQNIHISFRAGKENRSTSFTKRL